MSKYHLTHVYKRKNSPTKGGGWGPLGPPLNPPLYTICVLPRINFYVVQTLQLRTLSMYTLIYDQECWCFGTSGSTAHEHSKLL